EVEIRVGRLRIIGALRIHYCPVLCLWVVRALLKRASLPLPLVEDNSHFLTVIPAHFDPSMVDDRRILLYGFGVVFFNILVGINAIFPTARNYAAVRRLFSYTRASRPAAVPPRRSIVHHPLPSPRAS